MLAEYAYKNERLSQSNSEDAVGGMVPLIKRGFVLHSYYVG